MKPLYSKTPTLLLTLIVCFMATQTASGAATIVIQNNDAPNVGFNDPTPAAPVGGNSGTTVGQQRLIAFQFAANIWGSTLTSGPTITVRASWPSLECTADSAVLGAAGAASTFRNFPGAPFANTLYSVALANALANKDLNGSTAEIIAQFNNNIGKTGCLENLHWYYGLDTIEDPGGLDLVAVLLHELGHGLGFQTFTSNSGSQSSGFPSIYDRFLFDNTQNKTWPQMTTAERAESAKNTGNLVWIGQQVLNDIPGMLKSPTLRVNSPPSIAGNYAVGTAGFGPTLTSSGLTAGVVQALDPADSAGEITTDACSPLTNAAAVSGKIALIDRGTCAFTRKVKNAQNAGAVGVIVVDHTASAQPAGMSGSDSTITIPSVRVTLADGDTIKAQLASAVNATLLVDESTPGRGADSLGRPRVYAPDPTEGGSSISHWDTTLFPNQLMEPNINTDLTHSVVAPQDLSFALMRDIGWCVDCPKQSDPPPANDDFVNAQIVTGTQGSVNGTNVGATKEPGEPAHAGKAGGASVWYRWQAPATQGATFTTTGSNVDTLLAVYTGSSVTGLTAIASNDDFSGSLQSTVSLKAEAGVVYYFAVDANDGATGSIVFGWNQLPPGIQRGSLTNGATHTGVIGIGNVDEWTFQAAQNDGIIISIGEVISGVDPNFVPWIRLLGPDGALLGGDWNSTSAKLDVRAPLTGTYSVLVANNTNFPGGPGNYMLTLVKTPGPYTISAGDEGGPMTNGATHTGTIGIGDVDPWTFQAAANDNITLSIGEIITSVDNFVPWIRLRGPDGTLVGADWNSTSAKIDVSAPLTGTYTVVVANNTTFPDGPGRYVLTLVKSPGPYAISPGDEGGPMTNGATHTGAIGIGDVDAWTFQAAQNDGITISIGEVIAAVDPHFIPWIRLRGPDGALVGADWNSVSAKIDVRAPQTGTYTVVVANNTTFPDGPGSYILTLAKTAGPYGISAGDEGGPIMIGATHTGVIRIGDLDAWSFQAVQNNSITININEVTTSVDPNFLPWIRLRGPDGALLGSDWNTASAKIDVRAPLTGLYTVLVASNNNSHSGPGNYVLTVVGPQPTPPQLTSDTSGAATAIDSLLSLRDPFQVVNGANFLNTGTDRNTRVMVFVTNLQLVQGETSASVLVNLVDGNNQSYDVAAEDVRLVPNFPFTQVIFRLPDNLSTGTCAIKIKAHGQVSNAGTIRIKI